MKLKNLFQLSGIYHLLHDESMSGLFNGSFLLRLLLFPGPFMLGTLPHGSLLAGPLMPGSLLPGPWLPGPWLPEQDFAAWVFVTWAFSSWAFSAWTYEALMLILNSLVSPDIYT